MAKQREKLKPITLILHYILYYDPSSKITKYVQRRYIFVSNVVKGNKQKTCLIGRNMVNKERFQRDKTKKKLLNKKGINKLHKHSTYECDKYLNIKKVQ